MKTPSTFNFLLFTFLTLILANCNLSAPENENYFDDIEEKIKWANSYPLEVTVVLPSAWGTSPQAGTDRCFDNRRTNQTPRTGYEFTVQFNPNPIYGDAEWRAYRTSKLPADSNWYISPESIAAAVGGLEELDSEEISFSPGNITTVKVDITEDITIIPWTEPQPRVIISSPPLAAEGQDLPSQSPNRDITVTFAGPVDASTLKFGTEIVKIVKDEEDEEDEEIEKMFILINGWSYYYIDENGNEPEPVEGFPFFKDDPAGIDMHDRFWEPSYNLETYTLTIQPITGAIPEGLVIELKLGNGILSQGGSKGLREYILLYRTLNKPDEIVKWNALYEESSSEIIVEWENPNKEFVNFPVARYSVNNGHFQALPPLGLDTSLSIKGISPINDSGVLNGITASDINSYTILLINEGEETTIKIMNVPGMKVQRNWNEKPDITLVEIANLSDLEEMRDNVNSTKDASQGKIYSLMSNIELEEWVPIGTGTHPFEGKFYGNGHTITVESLNIGSTAYSGIFGKVQGSPSAPAEIRDLRIVYSDNFTINKTGTDGFYAGGIAGYIEDTKIRNVITRNVTINGEVSYNASTLWLGGIAGYMKGGIIDNSLAGLSVKGDAVSAKIGSVTGEVLGPGTGGSFTINNEYRNNELPNHGPNVTLNGLIFDKINVTGNVSAIMKGDGSVNIGGAAGISKENTMRDINVSGTVSMDRENVSINNDKVDVLGGVIGLATNTNMEKIYFSGAIAEPAVSSGNYTLLGGLVGSKDTKDKNIFINDCRVRGNIVFNYSKGGEFGGVFGKSSSNNGSLTMTNTFYEEGSITLNGKGETRAGGFAGKIEGSHIFNDSGTLGGSLAVTNKQSSESDLIVGGFVSEVNGTILNCISSINVTASYDGDKNYFVGGFAGLMHPGSKLSACYATGSVRVVLDKAVSGGESDVKKFDVGGFVGNSKGGTIEHSYATGNVMADVLKGSTAVRAGGLVGNAENAENNIENTVIKHSFSLGSVTAQSNGGSAYAGGIAGLIEENSSLSNTVALGDRVVAAGPTPLAGRVYGNIVGSGTTSDNYAINSMRTGTAEYNIYTPGNTNTSVDDSSNHGATWGLADTVTREKWEVILLEKDEETVWDFNTLVQRGYPVLLGLSGQ